MKHIAAIQMRSTPCLQDNLAVAEQLIEKAAKQGAHLVLLPEYFCLFAYKETDKLSIAEDHGHGPIQQWLKELSARLNIYIAAGSLPLRHKQSNKVTNTLLLFSPLGRCIARYDKLHLFSFHDGERSLDEGRTMIAGDQIITVDTELGRIGLSICYDLRFPELYRAMGSIDLLLMPAAFTVPTGKAHWEILLRARAIENQCYVLAAGQSGSHQNGRSTYGHSMIIDPWGDILASLPEGVGHIMAPFSLEHQQTIRHQLQALQHQRIDLHPNIRR